MTLQSVAPLRFKGVKSDWLSTLPDSGTEMLTISSTGVVSRQAIPSGGSFGALTGLPSDNAALASALNAKLGGSTGGTDNRILRADGTGGLTVQSSGVTIDDSANISCGNINGNQIIASLNGFQCPIGGNGYAFNSGGYFICSSNGVFKFSNWADTDFNRLQLGGTTSSFPSIKRNGAAINFRLADDSADATVNLGTLNASANITGSVIGAASGNYFRLIRASGAGARFTCEADYTCAIKRDDGSPNGVTFLLSDAPSYRMRLGSTMSLDWGSGSAFPMLKRNGTGLDCRLSDDTAFAPLAVSTLSASSTITSGAITAPSMHLAGTSSNVGVEYDADGVRLKAYSGSALMYVTTTGGGVRIAGTREFGWVSDANSANSGTFDTKLVRDAANTVAQRNGTTAQAFRVYQSFTDASNYHRWKVDYSGGTCRFGTERAGVSATSQMELWQNGGAIISFNSGGKIFFHNRDITFGSWNGGEISLRQTTSFNGRLDVVDALTHSTYRDIAAGRVFVGGAPATTTGLIKNTSGTMNFRLGNDSADCDITAAGGFFSGYITSGIQTLVADPSTVDITAGLNRMVKNSTSGEVRHWVNDGGTMKSVLFS